MIGIKSESSEKIIFSIIVGGALGNFYDRIVFNAVPDFIGLHYGNFQCVQRKLELKFQTVYIHII